MKGYIVKGIGGFYYVKTEEGVIECKPRGIFRKQKITPVAGDEVTLETENGAAVIAEIAPRKNVFVRPPVANLDVLFLVASTTQPTPSTLVLDKLSAIAVDKGVQPVIVCTKADLGEVEFLRSAYERSTLPFIAIRYDSGEGLDEVRQWISGRLCAFCGNSGVGKSTLLNTLLPQAERETSAISQKLGRGRHTTREVTIFEAFGGRIADTPGFASLEANRAGFIPKENLEHAFPEFGPYLGQCQFTGCSHRTEKGCAIRAALAEGKLSQTRYDSYCAMYEGSQGCQGLAEEGNVMRCVILSACPVSPELKRLLRPDDFIIACDAGYRNCAPLGCKPNIILGDFDTAPVRCSRTTISSSCLTSRTTPTPNMPPSLPVRRAFTRCFFWGRWAAGGSSIPSRISALALGWKNGACGQRSRTSAAASPLCCPARPAPTRRRNYFYFSALPHGGQGGGRL